MKIQKNGFNWQIARRYSTVCVMQNVYHFAISTKFFSLKTKFVKEGESSYMFLNLKKKGK